MLKKIIGTLKMMVIILSCLLIPLGVAMLFLKSSAREDAAKCVDTFMCDEGAGLAKYMALQFKSTESYVNSIYNKAKDLPDDPKEAQSALASIVKKNKNLAYVSVFKDDGILIASSSENETEDIDLSDPKYKEVDNKIVFSMDQSEENNDVIIKYFFKKGGKKNKKCFEIAVKWKKYETYLMGLKQGSFPRMFYIVSPDCGRYVSLHSLPVAKKNTRQTVALGLHLVKKLGSIKSGLSDVKVESVPFKIYKEEIKMPAILSGKNFSIIVVTDNNTVDKMLDNLIGDIPTIILMLIAVWLLFILVISRFYTRTQEQLEISNMVNSSTPLAIAIFRLSDGKIVQINASAMSLFRILKTDVDSVNIHKLFIYDDDEHYILNAVTSNVNVLNYEILAQSFGGGSFWAVCSASAIEIDEEPCVILAVLDINRRKEIEKKLANNAALLETQIKERTADLEIKAKELETSNALLEKSRLAADEANAAKTKFLANMSNELKTPINAIIGYSEILEEEALDRKDTVTADDLHKIISSAKHLLSLIDEILDLSSIESGKTQLFFENFEVSSLIKDVESVTMPLVTSNDNSLFVEMGKNVGAMYTDATKLRQCLLNLLGNAAKFTQFGKITLRVTSVVKNGVDYVEFAVMDTGCGIAPDRIDTLFDSFQDSQSKGSGAGLGLSITKKYVDVLKGTVSVESELGVGSKFTMKLPRKAEIVSSDTVIVKNQQVDDNKDLDEDVNLVGADADENATASSYSTSNSSSYPLSGSGGSDSNSNGGSSSFGRRSDV